MVAERDNQTVRTERSSALILLANARVWASEGWQVSITDADGNEFDPTGVEKWLTPEMSSPLQPVNASPLQEEPPQEEPRHEAPQDEMNLVAEAEDSYDDDSYRDDESYEDEESYEDMDSPESRRDDQDFSEAEGNLISATNP